MNDFGQPVYSLSIMKQTIKNAHSYYTFPDVEKQIKRESINSGNSYSNNMREIELLYCTIHSEITSLTVDSSILGMYPTMDN